MKENEAKEKWCPFARIEGGGSNYNRLKSDVPDARGTLCFAAGCMAWEPSEGRCQLMTQGISTEISQSTRRTL